MLDTIYSLKDKFTFKFLRPKNGEHKVDERADAEAFKILVREKLISAIIKGVHALPLIVPTAKTVDCEEAEIAHKADGFVVKKIKFLQRSVYFRSVFFQISKAFPISYTDESAAVMDAFFQESKLQDFIESHCGHLIKNIPLEKLVDKKTAQEYLKKVIANRLSIELENYFDKNQLLLLCVARAEGVKGASVFATSQKSDVSNDDIRNILDRRNYERPIFDDQYHDMRSKYKAGDEFDADKPFE